MRNWAYIKQGFTAVNSWGRAGVTGLTQRVVVKENQEKAKRKPKENRKKVKRKPKESQSYETIL